LEGDATKTIQLLEEKFDFILATSSTKIGKSIMQAAGKHLTPVTLELGGKRYFYEFRIRYNNNNNVSVCAK
jgi:aldehyde dehydrogenase (NAD+)